MALNCDFRPVLECNSDVILSVGYSIEAAIADIIDNSISASAGRIDIDFFPIGKAYIAILDDGCGMTEDELTAAMQYGSRNPLEIKDEDDLGRYGLGMLFTQFGIPAGAIGYVIPLIMLSDYGRTMSIVTDDAVVTAVVAKSENLLNIQMMRRKK